MLGFGSYVTVFVLFFMRNYIFFYYYFSAQVILELDLFEVILNMYLEGGAHDGTWEKELANNHVYKETLQLSKHNFY